MIKATVEEKIAYAEAVREFEKATERMLNALDAYPDKDGPAADYPKGLPSFDEFSDQVSAWSETQADGIPQQGVARGSNWLCECFTHDLASGEVNFHHQRVKTCKICKCECPSLAGR